MSASKKVQPSQRTAGVTYAVRDVVALAEQVAATGKEMLYLNIGDPPLFDFRPPEHVIDAVVEAMRSNVCGYGPSLGTPDALRAIEAEAKRKGIGSIQHSFVTTGVSEAIDASLTALVNPGDNVLIPVPSYPLYAAILSKLSAEANPYLLDESNNWQPDVADIAAGVNDRTRGIIVCNPNNPTGSLVDRQTLQAIVDLAAERGLVVFADEIYDKLIFDDREHVPMASLSGDAAVLTFNGLSKAYLAPGLRLGWGIVSGPAGMLDEYIEAIDKLLRVRLSAPHPSMSAIAPGLEGDHSHLTEAMAKLARRRDLTVQMLNAIDGISCATPGGAFYAFPRLQTDRPDKEFAEGLVRETGVVVVPGSGFGQAPGTQHFRVVFLPQEETLERAYRKIGDFTRAFLAGRTVL